MKYQELRDSLAAGPTPGPWSFKRHTSNLSGEHTKTDDWTIYGASGNAICFEGNAPELVDPEYIAAANPSTLRALLADLDASRELNISLANSLEAHAFGDTPAYGKDDEILKASNLIEQVRAAMPQGDSDDN